MSLRAEVPSAASLSRAAEGPVDGSRPVRESRMAFSWEPLIEGAWFAHGVLTAEECEALRTKAEQAGMEAITGDLRECDRAEVDDVELALRVWERIRGSVPATLHVGPGCAAGLPGDDEMLHGTWHAVSVNPHWRVCRYRGDGVGHFAPHADAAFTAPGLHDRSFVTINGYLDEVPEGAGGRTRFLREGISPHRGPDGRLGLEDESKDVLCAVRPDAPGCAVVFLHGLLHDGEPLKAGAPPKWIFRSEVVYHRDQATAPAHVQGASPAELEARALDVEAEEVERVDPMRAVELYKRAELLRQGRLAPRAAQGTD